VTIFAPPLRPVTDRFAVAPQLSPEDAAAAAGAGVVLVINNRPDGEEPGQPSGAEIAAAAEAAGARYLHLPFQGMPSPQLVEQMRAAIDAADGPAVAFCRSGTRSVFAWAVGRLMSGASTRDEVIAAARGAGYDLSPHLPR
jgi:uncharacterized protein (TIGR01244 family)